MSAAALITEGFGSFGDIAHVITQGYGADAVIPPPVTPAVQGGGTSKRKRKHKVIRFSDFETRDAYQAALHAELIPIVPTNIYADPEEDEDEILLKALMVILH